jgi:hypothetical protein
MGAGAARRTSTAHYFAQKKKRVRKTNRMDAGQFLIEPTK